ncbi:MAG: hypothetical protein ACLQVF_04375, partial [Isosphaeraceae bacterium]
MQYAWGLHGILAGPDGRLDRWQVTLDEAAKWFSANDVKPHELWFEDRERGNAPGRGGPPDLSVVKYGPASPPVSLQRDRASGADDHVPSIEVLVEIHQAVWGFYEKLQSQESPTSAQEEAVLPQFARLADALGEIRPVIYRASGWPTAVERALRRLVETFDAITQRWGWERVALAEPARSRFLDERRQWFREIVEGPMYEAALAISEGWNQSTRCPFDNLADEARGRRIKTKLTLQEGQTRFDAARRRLQLEPYIGSCRPNLQPTEREIIEGVFSDLHPHMLQIAPIRCGRPPWQEQSSVGRAAEPGRPAGPVGGDTRTPPATPAVAGASARGSSGPRTSGNKQGAR